MTPIQIALVQDSWARIVPMADQFSLLFYQRLAKTTPTLSRRLEASDPAQASQLMALLNTAVATLDLVENLAPALRALGQRMRAEGVSAAELQQAQEALLWTISQALGNRADSQTTAAWRAAATSLSAMLLDPQTPSRQEMQGECQPQYAATDPYRQY
ncbi:globin domain-containing protein [Haliea sp. E17]|uniref:globin domain-containing protein n=1 Tax=Haliea sp. E17 TaxID=3401576 RepID=UPI003AB011CF